ncbi:htpG [Wigglesworthia glossinidia endosymbiont of Glossina brevipalpis]|uniref:Chaperone protein HtpG n=1 Tax=Wigglesworthia glossinidia brevipalpis TaxID=36870 RepID=HTPG_WIGBR|nr:RecName: Full=Chaperone protein HtpG; AltName: Full=Heat shock protein HtpG; AltName: Full=High temperature protein G [Wigglesworthia glossinidia endosymbiont of Glossina brevipalpis]BAC24673.1 htpG [Wigglesworthia glossinidia endosymbiont of Glossina brevipalpis]
MQKKETLEFQSEVKQLLNLMIHSLYSNKEIFLRELISNASDALDKLRFLSISDEKIKIKQNKLCIFIDYDKNKKSITIQDNGIGMSKKEVIENLGTIAKSGTKSFIKSIEKSNSEKNNQLIGKFGVGFYSVFIVSEKVLVLTRSFKENEKNGVLWESSGKGEYTISNIIKKDVGTEITIFLKESEKEFCDELNIKNIVLKYSNHINFPIKLKTKITKDNKILTPEEKKSYTWKQINTGKSLWSKKKSEIKDIEYKEFYKNFFNDNYDPLIWSHNHVEGKQEYVSLLYIPRKASWDIWNREHKHGLKLYVKKVFIMDQSSEFIPNYLRFIKGIIDSNDLPLNVSREILQNNENIYKIKINLTKKALLMLENLSKNHPDEYKLFWKEFGLILKEGPSEDIKNYENVIKLFRFSSTYINSENQEVSLEDYVKRMQSGQNKIFYITSDNYLSAKNNPHLEKLKEKKIEVLLLFDRIDEWMMNYMTEFKKIKFQSISKYSSYLENIFKDENNDQKNTEQKLSTIILRIKSYLKDRVKDVRFTSKLTNSPSTVTTDENDITTQMSKLLISTGQESPEIKYIFELNANHPIIKHVFNIEDKNIFNNWIELLFEESILSERGNLDDPNKFIHRINNLLLSNIIRLN